MNAHRNRNRRLTQISTARPNRIVRPELLEKRQLLSCSTPTVQTVRGRDATFDQILEMTASMQALAHLTDDDLEGVTAVLE